MTPLSPFVLLVEFGVMIVACSSDCSDNRSASESASHPLPHRIGKVSSAFC